MQRPVQSRFQSSNRWIALNQFYKTMLLAISNLYCFSRAVKFCLNSDSYSKNILLFKSPDFKIQFFFRQNNKLREQWSNRWKYRYSQLWHSWCNTLRNCGKHTANLLKVKWCQEDCYRMPERIRNWRLKSNYIKQKWILVNCVS